VLLNYPGVVYGFNVPVNAKASALARTRNVLIRPHDVIYRLIADLRERLTKALPTLRVEEIIGITVLPDICFIFTVKYGNDNNNNNDMKFN